MEVNSVVEDMKQYHEYEGTTTPRNYHGKHIFTTPREDE
jgi:hypothetical protein